MQSHNTVDFLIMLVEYMLAELRAADLVATAGWYTDTKYGSDPFWVIVTVQNGIIRLCLHKSSYEQARETIIRYFFYESPSFPDDLLEAILSDSQAELRQ